MAEARLGRGITNRRYTTGCLELRKYDPVVRQHVIYREGKR